MKKTVSFNVMDEEPPKREYTHLLYVIIVVLFNYAENAVKRSMSFLTSPRGIFCLLALLGLVCLIENYQKHPFLVVNCTPSNDVTLGTKVFNVFPFVFFKTPKSRALGFWVSSWSQNLLNVATSGNLHCGTHHFVSEYYSEFHYEGEELLDYKTADISLIVKEVKDAFSVAIAPEPKGLPLKERGIAYEVRVHAVSHIHTACEAIMERMLELGEDHEVVEFCQRAVDISHDILEKNVEPMKRAQDTLLNIVSQDAAKEGRKTIGALMTRSNDYTISQLQPLILSKNHGKEEGLWWKIPLTITAFVCTILFWIPIGDMMWDSIMSRIESKHKKE